MKIDRLLGIVTILSQKDRVKAKELAERYEVSLRTIYRDLEDIGKAGFPIVTFAGGEGGIELAPGYTLNRSALSRGELQSILLGLKSLGSVLTNETVTGLLRKFSARQNGLLALEDGIAIDLASHYKSSLAPKIAALREAIATRKTVIFEYFSKNGRTEREIEPYFVAFKWSSWYVFGFCRLRGDFRLFKLNRLLRLRITERGYALRDVTEEDLNLEAFYSDPQTMREATLLFDRSLEYVLIDEYGPESYQPTAEGRLLAKWDYINEREMVKTVLGLGGGVKVLSPKGLADAVALEAQKICGRYK